LRSGDHSTAAKKASIANGALFGAFTVLDPHVTFAASRGSPYCFGDIGAQETPGPRLRNCGPARRSWPGRPQRIDQDARRSARSVWKVLHRRLAVAALARSPLTAAAYLRIGVVTQRSRYAVSALAETGTRTRDLAKPRLLGTSAWVKVRTPRRSTAVSKGRATSPPRRVVIARPLPRWGMATTSGIGTETVGHPRGGRAAAARRLPDASAARGSPIASRPALARSPSKSWKPVRIRGSSAPGVCGPCQRKFDDPVMRTRRPLRSVPMASPCLCSPGGSSFAQVEEGAVISRVDLAVETRLTGRE